MNLKKEVLGRDQETESLHGRCWHSKKDKILDWPEQCL